MGATEDSYKIYLYRRPNRYETRRLPITRSADEGFEKPCGSAHRALRASGQYGVNTYLLTNASETLVERTGHCSPWTRF